MSGEQEINSEKEGKTQPNFFAQFKKPTIALIIIMVFISFAKLYTPIKQQKKHDIETGATETLPEKAIANQQQNYTPGNSGIESTVPAENLSVITQPSIETARNDKRLIALEDKISKMQAEHETEITDLKAKFDSKTQASQNKVASLLSALIVFGQLKDAINSGKPYESELNQLVNLTAADTNTQEILSSMKNHSENGIIIPALLKEKFLPLIRQALFSKDESSYKNILNRFITIRKTGQQTGDDDESIIARAEFKLVQDDLKGAADELTSLTPQSQAVFSEWAQNANDWLSTQDKLSKLQLLLTKTEITQKP